MRLRGMVAGVFVLAVFWPAVGAAQEAPPDTTVPPATTVAPTTEPTTTAPPVTTVPEEAPPVTTAPAPAPEPAVEVGGVDRTLRVRPRHDLVDDQVVGVQGHGWRPNSYMFGAVQCRAGIAGDEGCAERPVETRTDGQGNYRVELNVQVSLDTEAGTFDCRVAPCIVRALDPRLEGSRSVRIYFDPAGPDPVRESATITPSADLVDGQFVTVVGQDFGTGSRYSVGRIIECRVPVTGVDDCDEDTEEYARIDDTGYLAESYRVEATPSIDGQEVDCRTTACALLVGDEATSLARAALIPLDFDPMAPVGPPPTMTVTPGAGLRDGQVVVVDGEGLPVDTYLLLFQCRWGATTFRGCTFDDYNYAKVRADGTFHTRAGLRAVFETEAGRVNCRVTACALVAFEEGYFYFSPESAEGIPGDGELIRAARTRLRFRPNGQLLRPTIETPDLTGVRANSRWRIHGTGGRPNGAITVLQCLAGAQSFDGCALGTRDFVYGDIDRQVGVRWETRFRFHRYLHLAGGGLVDCVARPCALVAVDAGAELDQSDRIYTTFVT